MSSKRLSPAAQLLRNSRLFSLPSAIPAPADGFLRGAASAPHAEKTTAHPIQQTLTTPSNSLARGDWGLKRPLPTKTTAQTSTPLVRVNALDTYEHITDFSSAADLTLTLTKLQELGISITTPHRQFRASRPETAQTVFEDALDNTDRNVAPDAATGAPRQRWKYDGPWLAGMTDHEFLKYLETEVPKHKQSFMEFLRGEFVQQQQTNLRRKNREQGRDIDDGLAALALDDAAFREWVLTLRANSTVAGELSELLSRHLDLPPVPDYVLGSSFEKALLNELQVEPKAPGKTHPSAGVTYLRSDARLENHPVFGPQRDRTPVEARVLRYSMGATYASATSAERFGVAGVVVQQRLGNALPVERVYDRRMAPGLAAKERTAKSPGFGVKGGNRVWVAPRSLNVDEKGRVALRIEAANGVAVGVGSGTLRARDWHTSPATGNFQAARARNDVSNIMRGLDRLSSMPKAETTTPAGEA